MATTIQKRGRRHTAAVRYKGAYTCSTFSTRLLAEQWADRIKREIERCLALGVPFVPDRIKPVPQLGKGTLDGTTIDTVGDADPGGAPTLAWKFEQVAEEYLNKVTPHKKSKNDERNRIRQLQKSELGMKLVKDVTPENVHEYLTGLRHHKTDRTLASVSIRNMAFLISSIFETARAKRIQGGFGLTNLTNPTRTISLPPPPKSTKQRNIDPGIMKQFFEVLETLRGEYAPWLRVFFILAVHTGMRRSELIYMTWNDLHETQNGFIARLNDTKSGYSRNVYLDEVCVKDIMSLKKLIGNGSENKIHPYSNIFPFSKHYASRKFHEVMTNVGYPNIRLHDLRHTALTNMANAGFTLTELMAQSGHRTTAVASRYLHVDEKTIRRKLRTLPVQ